MLREVSGYQVGPFAVVLTVHDHEELNEVVNGTCDCDIYDVDDNPLCRHVKAAITYHEQGRQSVIAGRVRPVNDSTQEATE